MTASIIAIALLTALLVGTAVFAARKHAAAYEAERDLEAARFRGELDRDLAQLRVRTLTEQRRRALERAVVAEERAADLEASDVFRLVQTMVEAFGQPVEDELQLEIDPETQSLRIVLLMEEVREYVQAEQARDIVEIADALGDILVIVLGTALAYGIPLRAVVEEIHRSNMTKVDPETGAVELRADGKVLKPATYEPPRLGRVLGIVDDVNADGQIDEADEAPAELEAAA